MPFYVYSITNKINGKKYVGYTGRTTQRRFAEHIRAAEKGSGCKILTQAIQKYGPESFVLNTEGQFPTKDEAILYERHLIESWDTISPIGYNITTGGEVGHGPHSEITKQKIGNRHARSYRVWFPDGHDKIITNLSEFCRQHDLGIPCMMRTNKKIKRKYRARLNFYKGYRCERI